MREYQKFKNLFWIIICVIIIGVIGFSTTTGDRDASREDSIYEKVFKLSAFFVVVLAVVLYWLVPKTKLAKHFKMNETLFVVTCIISIICGVIGLGVTFIWRELVTETHLFEFVLIPFGLIYVYWGIIMNIEKASNLSDLLDEKQIKNMTRAAAITLLLSLFVMLLMYFISSNKAFELEGKIWFLFYFFMTLTIYSSSTLYYFKKA